MSGINIQTRGEYPHLWKRGLIQRRVRQRANHCCEECGMEFQQGTNLAVSVLKKDGNAFVGTVHHIDGDKANCIMNNLVFLCQRCHYRLHLWGWTPGKMLPKVYGQTPPPWITARELPYVEHPQLKMFDLRANSGAVNMEEKS